jgi:nucleoside-diphosphate-sugar epimerase
MRALVTGATGMIGPALVNQLLLEGWETRIIARRDYDSNLFVAPVENVFGDIRHLHSLDEAMKGIDVVFHLAAKLHINDPSPRIANEYDQINVTGAANVASAALKAGVRRMVHFSTIGVYGPSFGCTPYTENSALNPQSLYAQTKAESEQAVVKIFSEQSRSSASVVRLAAVYGPRMQGNYRTLVKAMRFGLFCPVGSGQNRRTMIYIDDLVRAAILTAVHPAAAGRVYNITDGNVYTLSDVLKTIAHVLGKRPPLFHLPYKPIRAISALADAVTQTFGLSAPRLSALVDKLIEDVAASGEKLQRELSFLPQYSLIDGWKKALAN